MQNFDIQLVYSVPPDDTVLNAEDGMWSVLIGYHTTKTIFSSKAFNETPKSRNHNIYTLSSFLSPIPIFTDPRDQILQGL